MQDIPAERVLDAGEKGAVIELIITAQFFGVDATAAGNEDLNWSQKAQAARDAGKDPGKNKKKKKKADGDDAINMDFHSFESTASEYEQTYEVCLRVQHLML